MLLLIKKSIFINVFEQQNYREKGLTPMMFHYLFFFSLE